MANPERKPITPRKLNAEEKQKAKAWIERHSKGHGGCPICTSSDWRLSDWFVEVRPYYESAFLGGAVFPLIMVSCGNCGYTMLFHAPLVGIIKVPKDGE
jgi:hypothetical protein